MQSDRRLAILGGGNLGSAMARGLVRAEMYRAESILITRRTEERLRPLSAEGFSVTVDNREAVRSASLVLISVRPRQLNCMLDEIADSLDCERHVLVSTVTDVSASEIRMRLGAEISVIRAMPNVGVSVGESMTCLACPADIPPAARQAATDVFSALGRTQFIEEEQMTPATALCACGIAFFLRAIRAAAQGGVQVGFHADEAIQLAAQTARGAAELLLAQDPIGGLHPEALIDSVTTPLGVTIAGLNEMEHQGFSSAFIRGIVTAAEKAQELYSK
ncbi:pyrroline-5-carboxylate reductase [Candidatus Bipolaricaulota bacterium]|nr:pyrroline-5-carboxylate reductase [Candidatus Bipolaricaulota bacterium]